jgi:putative flippase GtrA
VIAGVSALLPEGLPPLLAVAGPKAVAIGVGLVVNYVLYDRLVFPAHARTGP